MNANGGVDTRRAYLAIVLEVCQCETYRAEPHTRVSWLFQLEGDNVCLDNWQLSLRNYVDSVFEGAKGVFVFESAVFPGSVISKTVRRKSKKGSFYYAPETQVTH
jgi:hypothetical protein